MPSGKPIKWAEYDHLIVAYLPTMTIADFAKTHLPDVSAKAVGARARKLGVVPVAYQPTEEHKQKIAGTIAKIGPAEVERIRELRDTHSVAQIATILEVDELTIHRAIARYGIILSEEGGKRAIEASKMASVGREPWNKGGELSEETKVKISEAASGEKNGQYGRGMTEEEKEKWRRSYFTVGIYSVREWLRSDIGQKLLAQNAAKQQTLEAKTANSLRSSLLMQQGVLKTWLGTPTRLVTAKGGEFTTKSSYETRFVKKLESDPEVVSFVYEPFRIIYEFEGTSLWYIPDFLVCYSDGREELVEVKPAKMVTLPKNVAKFEAGRNYHVAFRVVTEQDL